MPWTISTVGKNATIFADSEGLKQIIELAEIALGEGTSKVIDTDGASVTFVRENVWHAR